MFLVTVQQVNLIRLVGNRKLVALFCVKAVKWVLVLCVSSVNLNITHTNRNVVEMCNQKFVLLNEHAICKINY